MKKKTRFMALFSVPVIITASVLIVLYQASCFSGNAQLFPGANKKSPLAGSDKISNALEVQNAFREVFKLYSNSVVAITTVQTVKLPSHPFFNDPFFRDFFGFRGGKQPKEHKRKGLGTGFILSEDGYICTNYHVVANVDKVEIKVNDKTHEAKIVGKDQRTDLALLKIDVDEKLKPVYIGDSDTVKVGDWAIAIGNPFGLDGTFTTGVISATGRSEVGLMGSTQSHIQTDASINPGNSGGPLLNINGEVIGINRMIYSRTGGNIGIGFAIPINNAKRVLEQLKVHKKVKRGYIGVQIVPFTEEYAEELGLDNNKGALVGGVVQGSPAEEGGVKVGDVILKVDDTKINDFSDLVNVIEKKKIGKSIKLTVWRSKSEVTLFITIKERP